MRTRPRRTPEAHLVAVVRDALRDSVAVVAGEPRYQLRGWTRRPGGVDLAFDQGPRRVLIECKVDKPSEALWDALKLADIVCEHDVEAAYLLYDASDVIWRNHPAAPLFTEPARSWPVRDLIARWPKAWGDLLYGGRGIRPRETVAKFDAEPVAAVTLTSARTVRLLRITPRPSGQRQRFDDDGWPVGYEPLGDLRTISRYTDAPGPPPGDLCEACQGHPGTAASPRHGSTNWSRCSTTQRWGACVAGLPRSGTGPRTISARASTRSAAAHRPAGKADRT